jgi:HAD superfamily phosphoserine phosphatase-like hydrolase
MTHLICFDMDRVLVDHLSTWQYVYDQMGINNDEAFELYNQGKLDEWDWLKLDLALIKKADPSLDDASLRKHTIGTPLMKGMRECISTLIENGCQIAIISGGMQETARQIAAMFPAESPWRRRWGGIDRHRSSDSKLHVFTNGWLSEDGKVGDYGRYQVQMNGKGSLVRILQRRLGIPLTKTASIGDSAGDIGMFEQSDLSICFNPWDERPVAIADVTIREKDLSLVLQRLLDWIKE